MSIRKITTPLIGSHVSIQGGIETSVDRAIKLNFTAMQIFTKNNNQWLGKEISNNQASLFRQKVENSSLRSIIAHDSYLINLCAIDKDVLEKSRKAFVDEIRRCEILRIDYLNFHPGAHGGAGTKNGIQIIADSINIAHEATPDSQVFSMLETTAGQGNSIGHRFEELREIIDLVDDKNRMCVCIDTAHIFAAGYDLRTMESSAEVFREFAEIIGIDLLRCFHINDSKKPLASRVDRHEHIGKGFIGLEGFRYIMNEARFKDIPKILETPKGKEQLEDIENINALLLLMK